MTNPGNIRNFVIIAHIDHGKSTLADRMLELTRTVEARKMRAQYLDQMDLEREKGITIKMQPVRMIYHPPRGTTQNDTQNNAEFLYKDLTYTIRGALFHVRKKIGLGHKEQVYHNALEIEFKNVGLKFESKKNIPILYEGKRVGVYQPDFVIEDKVLIELKALPEIGKPQIEQLWSYVKGCDYKLALLVNFGSKDLEIKRIVYDKARTNDFLLRDSASSQRESAQVEDYILNLIDTPGHADFSYEVSRALAAVEGAILLVDATQGVQAQTLSHLHLARKEGLAIIPVLNKIDLPGARIEETASELAQASHCERADILEISAKTGAGVAELLAAVCRRVPPPRSREEDFSALIFDSQFDAYRGVIAHVRVFGGRIRPGERIRAVAAGREAEVMDTGYFSPTLTTADALGDGEIGYIATGLKEPDAVRVGDTLVLASTNTPALPGYREPQPTVFASVYPENADDHERLSDALAKMKLNDAAIMFEPESTDALGRGFRMGFLGMLHLDIAGERLRREYGLHLIFAAPSVAYRVSRDDGREEHIYSAARLSEPHRIREIAEPWVRLEVLTPLSGLGAVMELLAKTRGAYLEERYLGTDRLAISYDAPLADILVDFSDDLKRLTSGYGSYSYELVGYRPGDLVRLDMLIAGAMEPALSQIVPREEAQRIGRHAAAKLKELLPRQLFAVSIQAAIGGRVIARETLAALKKDVTGYLYGGDRTRKMKLWSKQQRGKERLKKIGRVVLPPAVFRELLKR